VGKFQLLRGNKQVMIFLSRAEVPVPALAAGIVASHYFHLQKCYWAFIEANDCPVFPAKKSLK
jgi:hypothetical protein